MKGSVEVPSSPCFGRHSPVPGKLTRKRLLAPLSWQRSGKIEPFKMHIVNACLEISKLLKTLKCALVWTGFKIQHRTMRNPASSSPVLNLPFLQKVVWKEDASQNQHLSSSNFWIIITQASGWLLEGKENIIYCGQWSLWGSGKEATCSSWCCSSASSCWYLKRCSVSEVVFNFPWSPSRYPKIGIVSLESNISKRNGVFWVV